VINVFISNQIKTYQGDLMDHILTTIKVYFVDIQRYLNGEISSTFRELRADNSVETMFILFGIAFLYGVIHAIGPGHGKVLVSSYFISQKKDIKKAFKLGFMVSIVHAFMALIITLVLSFVIKTMVSVTFKNITHITTHISGGLIILVGFYLFYEMYHQHKQQINISNKSEWALALSAGIVPCPGVMTIVLFSIVISKVYVGIISAIFMSIGMGLTISFAAILASLVSRNKKLNSFKYFGKIISIMGNLFIILLGCFLLFS
jgi:ABC-type nickel/cobalt efflux system permease component RcnA